MAVTYPFLLPEELLATLAPHSMTLRYVAGALILLYAVWTDLLHRRVSNRVWLVTLVVGAVFAVYDVLVASPALVWYLLVPVVMGVAYLLWRVRLLFGGADAKCIMAFALLVPYPPALAAGAYPHLVAFLPTAVTMLTNAVLFTLVVPLVYFVINLARGHVHPLAMFLGTRVKLDRVLKEPVWVMEWVRPQGGAEVIEYTDEDLDEAGLPPVDAASLEGAALRLHYMPGRAGDYALNLARLRALGVAEVWVTPKVPFMVPLFFGFLATFLAGDLIMSATLFFSGAL